MRYFGIPIRSFQKIFKETLKLFTSNLDLLEFLQEGYRKPN